MVQRDQVHLGSAGICVQSPAQHSGVRLWCYYSCGLDLDCGSNQIPGPEASYAAEPKMKKKQKQKQNPNTAKKAHSGVPIMAQRKRT